MARTAAESAVRTLAGEVIERAAPEETVFFAAACDRFLARARRAEAAPGGAGSRRMRAARGGGDDDLLGYGVGEAVALLTPVVLFIASAVVQRLAERTGDALVDRGSVAGRRLFRRLVRRNRKPEPQTTAAAPALAVRREQLPELRRLVQEAAAGAGLGEERTQRVVQAFLDSVRVLDE